MPVREKDRSATKSPVLLGGGLFLLLGAWSVRQMAFPQKAAARQPDHPCAVVSEPGADGGARPSSGSRLAAPPEQWEPSIAAGCWEDLVAGLSASDFPDAIQGLERLSPGYRDQVLPVMLKRWASLAPQPAFEFVGALPANEENEELVRLVIRQWMVDSRLGPLIHAQGLPNPASAIRFGDVALSELAKVDVDAAMKAAGSPPRGFTTAEALSSIAAGLSYSEPDLLDAIVGSREERLKRAARATSQ
jgi:hypothetical protein